VLNLIIISPFPDSAGTGNPGTESGNPVSRFGRERETGPGQSAYGRLQAEEGPLEAPTGTWARPCRDSVPVVVRRPGGARPAGGSGARWHGARIRGSSLAGHGATQARTHRPRLARHARKTAERRLPFGQAPHSEARESTMLVSTMYRLVSTMYRLACSTSGQELKKTMSADAKSRSTHRMQVAHALSLRQRRPRSLPVPSFRSSLGMELIKAVREQDVEKVKVRRPLEAVSSTESGPSRGVCLGLGQWTLEAVVARRIRPCYAESSPFARRPSGYFDSACRRSSVPVTTPRSVTRTLPWHIAESPDFSSPPSPAIAVPATF
jgi:hypothetical protein